MKLISNTGTNRVIDALRQSFPSGAALDIASLFTPGGTHAGKGEFAGMNDFEVVAYLMVLPETS